MRGSKTELSMLRNQATRVPLKSRSRGAENRWPDPLIEIGQRESEPAITLSSSEQSGTWRGMGPRTGMVDQAKPRADCATRPGAGRRPTTPQNAAGLRNDPPASLPSAIGSMPVASATAAPPEDPPQVFD